jgi:membrane-bound ClpP family serine protease
MRNLNLIILSLMTLSSTAMAANPVEMIVAPLQSNINLSPQELEKKAMEHITQGNLTKEHISQDVNATKEQLKKQDLEQVNKSLNITPEKLQQRAKEELKNQVNQRVQQPGFEVILAVGGILGIAFALRRNN